MATRRAFNVALLGSLAAAVSWERLGATGKPRLLLLRQGKWEETCVRCIPGVLYGVPERVDLATAEQQLALLQKLCDVVELSYENNVSKVSSIPVGTYEANVRGEGTKPWMWSGGKLNSGRLLENRAWRLELSGTQHRTAIQFHYGKDVAWSKGCAILGLNATNVCHDECRFSDSPEKAVAAVRGFVEQQAQASGAPVLVRIA